MTSFGFVKAPHAHRYGSACSGWAYVFFGLAYVHLMLMLAPASRGGEAAVASVAVAR